MSKAPGVMVVSWLSYSDSRRTLCNPVKLSLWTQLILLFLSILKGRDVQEHSFSTAACHEQVAPRVRGGVTHSIRSPSSPRNIPLRTESI